ncbi:NAD(P)/FAD-dependent oxidoreductase [Pseudomonas putida]|uniref:NAD(P)/FAD-dependent oxidoreductase n=1 Tax=Pseudomonas putida TaxID=303 RepID=UPI003D971FEA
MPNHDVVIIGGGPAGCAAAIYCALQGLSVALLEQSAVCRDRPGETLPPGIEPLLQQLGVVLPGDVIRHAGHWVQWGAARHFNKFGGGVEDPWRGFQIPRRLLDTLLLDRVQALGVSAVRPCRANEVILQDNRVIGVQTDLGAFHCSHLIDASGARGWLARQLPLGRPAFSGSLLALYGYGNGQCATCEDAPHIIADEGGWYWLANIGIDVYAWTRLRFDPRQSHRHPPLEFVHLHDLSRTRGADVTWRACRQCAGAGYFIVGDAACILDPGSAHGVLKAIMSGMMAAHAVVKSLDHATQRQQFQSQYRHWMNSWFVRDMNKMRGFYAAHPTPPAWLTTLPLNEPIIHFDTQDVSGI